MVYLILKATNKETEIATRLHRDSVKEVHFQDHLQTHTQALLKEHKDIIIDMQKLVGKLAEFEDYPVNTELCEVFWKMWHDEKQKRAESTGSRRVRSLHSWTPSTVTASTITATTATTATAPQASNHNEQAPHLIPDGWD
eukprot:scaffold3419_cov142-Amphora_coffeaeformis.AAC.1